MHPTPTKYTYSLRLGRVVEVGGVGNSLVTEEFIHNFLDYFLDPLNYDHERPYAQPLKTRRRITGWKLSWQSCEIEDMLLKSNGRWANQTIWTFISVMCIFCPCGGLDLLCEMLVGKQGFSKMASDWLATVLHPIRYQVLKSFQLLNQKFWVIQDLSQWTKTFYCVLLYFFIQ